MVKVFIRIATNTIMKQNSKYSFKPLAQTFIRIAIVTLMKQNSKYSFKPLAQTFIRIVITLAVRRYSKKLDIEINEFSKSVICS